MGPASLWFPVPTGGGRSMLRPYGTAWSIPNHSQAPQGNGREFAGSEVSQ